jgi:hypothetical protein
VADRIVIVHPLAAREYRSSFRWYRSAAPTRRNDSSVLSIRQCNGLKQPLSKERFFGFLFTGCA